MYCGGGYIPAHVTLPAETKSSGRSSILAFMLVVSGGYLDGQPAANSIKNKISD